MRDRERAIRLLRLALHGSRCHLSRPEKLWLLECCLEWCMVCIRTGCRMIMQLSQCSGLCSNGACLRLQELAYQPKLMLLPSNFSQYLSLRSEAWKARKEIKADDAMSHVTNIRAPSFLRALTQLRKISTCARFGIEINTEGRDAPTLISNRRRHTILQRLYNFECGTQSLLPFFDHSF